MRNINNWTSRNKNYEIRKVSISDYRELNINEEQ